MGDSNENFMNIINSFKIQKDINISKYEISKNSKELKETKDVTLRHEQNIKDARTDIELNIQKIDETKNVTLRHEQNIKDARADIELNIQKIDETKNVTLRHEQNIKDARTDIELNIQKIDEVNSTYELLSVKAMPSKSEIMSNTFKTNVITKDILPLSNVIKSLEAFQVAMYRVNYLNNLIDKNSQQIIKNNNYSDVLTPLLNKIFTGEEQYCWIFQADLKKDNISSNKGSDILSNVCYFEWFQLSEWNNLTILEISEKYPSYANLLQEGINNDISALKNLTSTYPSKTSYNYLFKSYWDNGIKLKITIFRKDLIKEDSWISISSGINLEPYLPNTDNIDKFSEQYSRLIDNISVIIDKLNDDNWVNKNFSDIWTYTSPDKFEIAKCISSINYPQWTNQLISKCFIPNSNINVPQIISNVINNLYYNYPQLYPGQIAFGIYNFDKNYYLSLCQIEKDGISFKKFDIFINDFFVNKASINNDVIFKGILSVEDSNKDNIIYVDNIKKITCFDNKIGINQDPYEVDGLLDIDNLSISKIVDTFVTSMHEPLINSYQVVNNIKSTINYGQRTIEPTLFKDYLQDVVIFKIPIKVGGSKEVTFLYYSPDDIFTSFSDKSLNKLKDIIKDVSNMEFTDEIDFINNDSQKNYVFSFMEDLNDNKYDYSCSIRSFIKYDKLNTNSEMYFVMSFKNINHLTNDKSYLSIFNTFSSKISASNKLVNYSILLAYNKNIQENLFKGLSIAPTVDTPGYFSTTINTSDFFRTRFGSPELYSIISDDTNEIYIVNEYYPQWNLKSMSTVYLPNTNIKTVSISEIIYRQYENKYGDLNGQNFYINYPWINDMKIACRNIININDKKYGVCCGFNVLDYLNYSLKINGDNIIQGNIINTDINGENIFKTDIANQQILNLYKVGVGTSLPKAMLDVNDSGIGDIIKVINEMANEMYLINTNFSKFINASDDSEFVNLVKDNFIDPSTNKQLEQNPEKYIVMSKINKDLDDDNFSYIYHYIYQQWNGQLLKNVNDPNNQKAIDNILNLAFPLAFYRNMFFNNGFTNFTYNFTFGMRQQLNRYFILNDSVYNIGMGVNLQNLNIQYSTNKNLQYFFNYLSAYSLYLQDVVSRLQELSSNDIINYQKFQNTMKIELQNFPIQTLKQYKIDLKNIKGLIVSDCDFYTLSISNSQKYTDIKDVNLKNKLYMFSISVNTYYPILNKGDYGMVHFEDAYDDFFSLFYCADINTNDTITLYSFELQINKIIPPSFSLRGDSKINGDLYMNDANDNNYVLIDTENKFLGVNTKEIFVNYSNTYSTTTNGSLTKQNMVVKSKKYPVIVSERINEKTDPSFNNYQYFKNFSSSTLRRTSNLYGFDDMLENSKKYTTKSIDNLPNAFGPDKNGNYINRYHYGADLSFEIKSKENVIREVGDINIGIESIITREDGMEELKGCFSVTMVDTDPVSNDAVERSILFVENNSTLHVNKIKLGGKLLEVDGDGNLLFNGKKVMLEQ